MIDEHILPARLYRLDGGRRLQANACTFVSFYFHAADKLTATERSNVIKLATKDMAPDAFCVDVHRDRFLLIDFKLITDENFVRHKELSAARAAVVEDSEILGGIPVFKRTRIPVRDVAASLAKGVSTERLLRAYPALNERLLHLATVYTEATPPRGRPKKSRPEGATTRTVRRKSRL